MFYFCGAVWEVYKSPYSYKRQCNNQGRIKPQPNGKLIFLANTKYQLRNLYLRFPLNVQFHHAHTQLSLIHFNLFHFCCCMHWAQDASQLGVRPPLGRPQLCCWWWLLPPAETPDCPARHLHTLPALAQLDLQ